MNLKRRTILFSILILLLMALAFWASYTLANHQSIEPTAHSQPRHYGVPQKVPATQASVTDTPTDSQPTDPVAIEQPAPYGLLDFSVNNVSFSNTDSFSPPTDPGFDWIINVSFTPTSKDDQALLFVMNADVDCSGSPANTFGCGVINLADVETNNEPVAFSFPEQGMTNKVYLKLASGDWHVTVTAYGKPLYPVISAETMADYYGN